MMVSFSLGKKCWSSVTHSTPMKPAPTTRMVAPFSFRPLMKLNLQSHATVSTLSQSQATLADPAADRLCNRVAPRGCVVVDLPGIARRGAARSLPEPSQLLSLYSSGSEPTRPGQAFWPCVFMDGGEPQGLTPPREASAACGCRS